MSETIRIYPYSNSLLPALFTSCEKHSVAILILATLLFPTVSSAWGAQFEVDKLEKALTAPPHVPQQSQDLANQFLNHTLPKLLANDEQLALRLGFDDRTSNQITIDRVFSMMVIRREDVLSLIERRETVRPIDLVNNTNNWLEDQEGRLVPKRIVFLLKASDGPSEGVGMRSSVTLEQSGDGSSWRIIQVGAPKLSQAMSQQGDSDRNFFLLWIPDLNRHYLGSIQNHVVTLKVLFKDRLLNGDPGDNQPITPDYLGKLGRLYAELEFPKKSRPKVDEGKKPPQVQEDTRPKTDKTQRPEQAP